jgi:exodeoxyribonuclease V beta subunit
MRSLGVAGDTDAGAELVDNLDDLVVEVVDDLYLQRFGHLRERPPFDRNTALSLGRTVVADPQAALAPADHPDSQGGARVAFAEAVRTEVDRRKRRLGILSYDDLLSRLATALEDQQAPARMRMRGRWRIVLVDEFQDTDPVQWEVLDRAFTGHATMVLIGDPKQAIYAFRGGDVVTYLDAARTATTQATLGTNWRSDTDLVQRLQVVLRGAALGHREIQVRDVEAHHPASRLSGAPHPSPFRLRRVPRRGFRLKRGLIGAPEARAHIAVDCAADISELLSSAATWDGEPLEARHIAVLVGVRDHGLLVQRALHDRGVPAVLAGGGHVFATPAADEWLALLDAMAAPHRAALVRSAALTSFFGYSTRDIDEGGELLTGRVADTLRGWALLLRSRGVAALFEAAEERGLTARVLGVSDGERVLTDLRHLTQLLHETAVRDRLGLTALLAWFREEQRRTSATERPRRLDSDAAAVQIITVHGSKGLQYPITYLPFAYQSFEFPTEVALYHDDGRRTLDVSGSGTAWEEHLASHRAEEAGEELRDLYVALTRAQSQVVAWWAPTANTRIGGLHRLLFGRQPGTPEVPDAQDVKDDDYAARVLDLLAQLGGPTAEVCSAVAASVSPEPRATGPLAARTFEREVDTEWRRTSYSGLIRIEAAQGEVGSEPEVVGLEDEPEAPEPAPPTHPGEVAPVPSPMADLPAGAAFGSLVHATLEHADPEAPDLRDELRTHAAQQLPWWPVDISADTLADALLPLHDTPLGPLAPGLTLGAISLPDRLRELDFEIPLLGGDVRTPERDVRLGELAPLLRTHLSADDPLVSYADRLARPPLGDQALRGYLSGSIDVVLRLHTPDGPRFVVVDYKTNLLGDPDQPLTAADYAPARLAEAMLHSHYPLQALLYSVVVHRYLRWRLPTYDPASHLGGVLYLYLRGMCGPQTPLVDGHPTGVFSWRPPAALIESLSDLLDGVKR